MIGAGVTIDVMDGTMAYEEPCSLYRPLVRDLMKEDLAQINDACTSFDDARLSQRFPSNENI